MVLNAVKSAWFRSAALAFAPIALCAQTAPEPPAAPMAPEQAFRFVTGGSFLGVGVREIDSDRAKELKLREEYGVEVTKVESDSPAEKAGIKVGDVIQEYQGQRVEGTEQLIRLVRETPSGRAAKLAVVRNGASQSVTATIATRKGPAMFSKGFPVEIRVPDREFNMVMPDVPKAMMSWRSGMIGVEGESLADSQLASFFGVKEGVLVRSVLKGSAAERAGIKAGDVLLKVNDSKVTAPRDVTAAIRDTQSDGKKTFPVIVMRERKELTLSVTIDDDSQGRGSAPLPRTRSVTTGRSPL